MIRPLLSLERLSFMEPEGKVGYRHGQGAGDQETMDYLEFIARVTSHIPDKGQVTVRYYGLYANAHRGKVKKASLEAFPLRIIDHLKLTFIAERPPPPQAAFQEYLWAADPPAEYFP